MLQIGRKDRNKWTTGGTLSNLHVHYILIINGIMKFSSEPPGMKEIKQKRVS
jgi:hypothetical protein